MIELKTWIEPIQCYCAINNVGYPILESINMSKIDCFKFSKVVVKIGIQMHIPIEYKSYKTVVFPTLAKGLYCVIYKENTSLCFNSIKNTAKAARNSVSGFNNTRYKVVKCEILLLTQQQHLRKSE